MRIVTTTEHVYRPDVSIERQLDILQDAGFDAIDFTTCCYLGPGVGYGENPLFGDDWKAWIRDVRAYGDSKGITFTQTHNLMFNYFKQDAQTELLNRMVDRAIEVNSILGAPLTVVHPIAPPGAERDVPACLKANANYFKEKARLARDLGVKLALENMIVTREFDGSRYWRYCAEPGQLIDLADAIDAQNVGFCLDTGHSHYMGEDIYQSVMGYRERLISLHIHDNDLSGDQHVTPYAGSLDWDAFLRALADSGYAGDFSLESFRSTIRLPGDTQGAMLRAMHDLSKHMVLEVERYKGAGSRRV